MKLVFLDWDATLGISYSMLGLGNVAARGLLIALMLHFNQSHSKSFESGLIRERSLLIGLAVTIGAYFVLGAAQPALLRLVPSLVLTGKKKNIFLALYNSETSLLLNFMDKTSSTLFCT
ncbi:hypothetical protein L7F22_049464 [Adiantum nelumboides]|nr:hypothetical protein [Adiantum nelumboides]